MAFLDSHKVENQQSLSQTIKPNSEHIPTFPWSNKELIRLEVNEGETVLVAANKDVRDSVPTALPLKEKRCFQTWGNCCSSVFSQKNIELKRQ